MSRSRHVVLPALLILLSAVCARADDVDDWVKAQLRLDTCQESRSPS
jgi:hypothetical protein